ncbi:Alpha/Beta hydrolase protein [Lipomyces chichibuensis]|uniref:Alpha/Beta hydrolase protein n=1 Tax=Lipomyces chichibuensis TaxID=1546026 RepID=UPI00334364BC
MTRLISMAIYLLCLAMPMLASPSPRPVVIWHGLGDSYDSDGMQRVAALIQEIHPGIFVHSVYLNRESSQDSKESLLGKLDDQLALVCDQLASIPELEHGFDGLGFSQGGLFLRGYVERCNAPKAYKLVTFGSPHNGVADFPPCNARDFVCRRRNAFLKTKAYSQYAQESITVAQYYRDPDQYDTYLERSGFLADINNERRVKNATYAENLSSLENLVLYLFTEDETVVPKETAWFAEVNKKTGVVTPLEERKIYIEDWFGLKALGESGRVHFGSIEGQHMRITNETMIEIATKYLGTEVTLETEKGEPIQQQKTLEEFVEYVNNIRNERLQQIFAAVAGQVYV